ncbi:MAG: T9SS type A sorting domain-containing protein [Flavobacteriales bacterium]
MFSANNINRSSTATAESYSGIMELSILKRLVFSSLFFTIILLLTCTNILSQSAPISIDGTYSDWTSSAKTITDSSESISGIDLLELSVSNDENFLFIKITTNSEFDLTDNTGANNIRLYMDTDNNDSMGYAIQSGYGSELGIIFNSRYAHYNVTPYSRINFSDFSFRVSPTFTSNVFEMAIRRDAIPDGTNPLFTDSTIRILLLNSSNGDRLPNTGKVFTYTFDNTPTPAYVPINITKEDTNQVRVIAYNTYFNGLDDPARIPALKNIITTLSPDIIGFSECWNTTAATVKGLMDTWLPTGDTNGWYVEKHLARGLITASRWEIKQSWFHLTHQFPTLINLPERFGTDFLFTNSHLSCCQKEEQRQGQADNYIEFILDAKTTGGLIDLPENTPFACGGDFNLVGYAQQLNTLVTGDIQDVATYGVGSPPDWDNTNLTHGSCLQSDKRMDYTYRNDNGNYPPGKLDFIIYSDAVMTAEKSFVLQTEVMSTSRLFSYGLNKDDTQTASDHFPVVKDFSMHPISKPKSSSDILIFPNPATDKVNIRFNQTGNFTVLLFDISGNRVLSKEINIENEASESSLDIENLSSGVYLIKIIKKDGKEIEVKKIMKI